jgi:hypothetical protein
MTEAAIPPDSLLPYAAWTEEALRSVARDALEYVGRAGLPGEHHFYITFRTDFPHVVIPGALRARFPQEMTIVLQHKFWDLKVDRAADTFSVGLSFNGIGSTLVVPFAAITAFNDPHVGFGLRFEVAADEVTDAADEAEAPAAETKPEAPPGSQPQVVSLDAFRRKRD